MGKLYSHWSALAVLSPQYLATFGVAAFEVVPPDKTGCMVVPFPCFFAQT